ncbi:hypothetical protein [uncultured Adlercreutzia sp.]|uniref:hypothetical protein n=1 Tax=uncultured Adlercreutzia sp. TaxID=875803 RepID=UPI0025F15E79|nr:hypothetical protein [uncultured Adlercreutzia sp.]
MTHAAASREALNPRIAAFARAVATGDAAAYDGAVARGEIDAADSSVTVLKWRTSAAEQDAVAPLVRALLAEDASLAPHDVYVAAWSGAQAQRVVDDLRRYRLESSLGLFGNPLAADARMPERARTREAYARLALAAEGDRRAARLLRWGPEEATAFQERTRGLRGLSLLASCNPEGDEIFSRLCGAIEGDEAPADLLARVLDRAGRQAPDSMTGAVNVGPLAALAQRPCRVALVLSAVEGLQPACAEKASAEDAEAAFRAERRRVARAFAAVRDKLVISTFSLMPEAQARSCGAAIVRTRCDRGETVALMRPSRFLADAGNAAPGTESGEQYLTARC